MPDTAGHRDVDYGYLDRRLRKFEKDRFVGAAILGALPRIPSRTALPVASASYEGCIVYIPGTTGHIYVCMMVASTWTWVSLN